MPTAASTDARAQRPRCGAAPGPAVTLTALLVAVGSLGFALVNVVFELTDHFASGPHADYAAAISVMDWFVAALKVVGAAAAVLSVAGRPRVLPPAALTVLLWASFATLAVYALGALAEAVGMAVGLMGGADRIDVAGIAYVMFFLAFAAGFGVLAVSYSRRHRTGARFALLGVLAAPVVLGTILAAMPALLAALGLMPAS